MPLPFRFGSLDFLFKRFWAKKEAPAATLITNVSCIDILPEDVILEIMGYLDVVETIRMRRVSKLYYYLTHHPVLWKRKLRETDLPLHPLPYTFRHSLDHLTGLEAERILVRSISFERNWFTPNPEPLRAWSFTPHHRILDMTLLPGGQYLIASVTDPSFTRFSLIIYAMDCLGTARPIAKTDTESRAYDIRAKYMTVSGSQGIAITYLRRGYLSRHHRERMAKGLLPNTNEYSTYHEIEPERPLKYESVTLHARLTALQCLLDIPYSGNSERFVEEAKKHPPPFRLLIMLSSRSVLMSPSLEELWDQPYLAVVKRPNDIYFVNLNNGGRAVLTCAPTIPIPLESFCIKAMRLVKEGNQAFIVRSMEVPPGHPDLRACHTFELYAALSVEPGMRAAPVMRNCESAVDLANGVGVTHVFIADSPVPPRDDNSILATLRRDLGPEAARPPPISVFFRSTDVTGFRWVKFFPSRVDIQLPPTPPSAGRAPAPPETQTTFRYELWHAAAVSYDVHPHDVAHVLPATVRPLVYWTEWDDTRDTPKVKTICPVYDKLAEYARVVDGALALPADIPGLDDEDDEWPDQIGQFGPTLRAFEKEVAAIAWDEHIGRLVVAPADGQEIAVYDFAQAPRQNVKRERYPLPVKGVPDPDNKPDFGWVYKQVGKKPLLPYLLFDGSEGGADPGGMGGQVAMEVIHE